MVSYDSKTTIVGGGVFGLGTAFWLARSGYEHVTVFDRRLLDEKHYEPSDECDGGRLSGHQHDLLDGVR